ncbi:alpha/beta fold hydrolase [Bacillus hwajinpoensis]|uniref:Alpha/beta fold hydrolase n=1 Tax=Guptibacillus hwajinpoensis TaxID=208199 RepID=A0A845ETG4_9BACL|nr:MULTISPECIES: alpha/beta hydrolase [Bacillaceae]MYL62690.1 alpha/beta fold hydrolase [Pseudalkalibacillus hwajinpoensis]
MRIKETEYPKGVIVLVHGANEHHRRYDWLVSKWIEAGYHVVLGDLPGQGESTRRRGHIDSFDQYIETIDKWIKRAHEFQLPVFLLGHSMGGLASIRTIMEKRPSLTGVILSSPCIGLVNPPNKGVDILSKVLNPIVPSLRLNSKLEPNIGTRNPEFHKRDQEDPLMVQKVSVRWYRELLKAMKIANEGARTFHNLPLLVVQGGDDRIVDKQAVISWFNRIPLKEKAYKEWDGFYHEVFNEPDREDVFQTAKSFVELKLELLYRKENKINN